MLVQYYIIQASRVRSINTSYSFIPFYGFIRTVTSSKLPKFSRYPCIPRGHTVCFEIAKYTVPGEGAIPTELQKKKCLPHSRAIRSKSIADDDVITYCYLHYSIFMILLFLYKRTLTSFVFDFVFKINTIISHNYIIYV